MKQSVVCMHLSQGIKRIQQPNTNIIIPILKGVGVIILGAPYPLHCYPAPMAQSQWDGDNYILVFSIKCHIWYVYHLCNALIRALAMPNRPS